METESKDIKQLEEKKPIDRLNEVRRNINMICRKDPCYLLSSSNKEPLPIVSL
jgi:hypothetical protein